MNEERKKLVLKTIKNDLKAGKYAQAFANLNTISEPTDDFVIQDKFAKYFKVIPPGVLGLKKLRVAIVASSTVSHFSDILRYWLAKEGLEAQIFEAEYNTVHQTVLDPNSSLYVFQPDVVMLFTNYRDVDCDIALGSPFKEVQNKLAASVHDFITLWKVIQQHSRCYIIQNNADLPFHRVLGNYEGTALWGYLNMLRGFNLELAKAIIPGSTIFDLDYISSVYGKERWHDTRYWYHSKHAFALDATGLVAYSAAKIISSIKGLTKKCLVLDLDNTLWGGVIGDDGIDGIRLGHGPDGEAFLDFQKFLLRLKDRGIILAVSSKNEENAAKEPFLRHPDMLMRLDDIVVFKANWEDKATNIQKIAAHLNIGLDSIVFVDDDPAERELVRSLLPMVSVPELPSDPAEYVAALSRQSYFETVMLSDEDRIRSAYYRANIKRAEFQKESIDLSGYLKDLHMEMLVGDFDDFYISRIAQLINKSNQFHLTATRYTESEIRVIQNSKNKYCRYFKLRDRFGDNGLICAIILDRQEDGVLFIDTWVMSCRVLSRGVEEFVCGEIVSLARQIGCKKIIGKYIPTKKNQIVSRLYEKLHFIKIKEEQEVTFWELAIDDHTPEYSTFVKSVVVKE